MTSPSGRSTLIGMGDAGLTVRERGWDGPWYRVRTDLFELRVLAARDEDLRALNNVDAEVWLADSIRWSATILTVGEVQRLMSQRWPETGEYSSGGYWSCPDGLIVRDPGLDSITGVVAELIDKGELTGLLRQIG